MARLRRQGRGMCLRFSVLKCVHSFVWHFVRRQKCVLLCVTDWLAGWFAGWIRSWGDWHRVSPWCCRERISRPTPRIVTMAMSASYSMLETSGSRGTNSPTRCTDGIQGTFMQFWEPAQYEAACFPQPAARIHCCLLESCLSDDVNLKVPSHFAATLAI